MTTEYFIADHGNGTYEIAKFVDSSEPAAVYTVKGKSCDCPGGSRRGTCKHIAMVANWKPGHYYEGAGTVIMLPLENIHTET